ncbi:MAG: hypothetical protein V3V28_06460 [Polaribacter sp.]|uniref:hypothetical protein n=1 Tax=Polaribacter sp. TaxID=1920175 RepID=UPI002F35C309
MRKIIFFLILFTCINCNKHKKITGYYINLKTSDIYEINDEKLIIYNLEDSISYVKDYKYKNGILKNKYEKYTYSKISKDSLTIFNFSENNEDVHLLKFKYGELSKLYSKNLTWFSKNLEESTQYLSFKKGKISNLLIDSNDDKINNHFSEIEYRGKYFNKFYVYVYNSIIIPTNIEDEKVSFLIIDYMNSNKVRKDVFQKTIPKLINKSLIGKWEATENYTSNNYSVYQRQMNTLQSKSINFSKEDSIINSLDYRNIEFTVNNKFKKFVGGILKEEYELENSPLLNYYFFKDKEMKLNYFKTLTLTENKLKIKIYNRNLIVSYKRKGNGTD